MFMLLVRPLIILFGVPEVHYQLECFTSRAGLMRFSGIRSRTNLTEDILAAGKKLLVAGCFCIGTNQVDLDAAKALGVPVFNSPFCNSRSVGKFLQVDGSLQSYNPLVTVC